MNKSQPFRQHLITRALKGASNAGMRDPTVKIVLSDGTQLHVAGGVVEAPVPKVRGKSASPVRDPSAVGKGRLPASKNRAPLAAGGDAKMFGKQAADPAPAGRTAKPKSAADAKQASGGLSRPARAGACGT
jgi:hypothetical protein